MLLKYFYFSFDGSLFQTPLCFYKISNCNA